MKFIEKHGLPFVLLADENHEVAELYDVWKLKKNFGKEYMGIERSTFLINKEGILVKEWRKVKVKDHVEEALEFFGTWRNKRVFKPIFYKTGVCPTQNKW